jgi:hypothetical protein
MSASSVTLTCCTVVALYFKCHSRKRGSKASRNPSPKKLRANTTGKIAVPGRMDSSVAMTIAGGMQPLVQGFFSLLEDAPDPGLPFRVGGDR